MSQLHRQDRPSILEQSSEDVLRQATVSVEIEPVILQDWFAYGQESLGKKGLHYLKEAQVSYDMLLPIVDPQSNQSSKVQLMGLQRTSMKKKEDLDPAKIDQKEYIRGAIQRKMRVEAFLKLELAITKELLREERNTLQMI